MNSYIDPLKTQEIKVATDAVCIGEKNNKKYILLIKREYEPFKNHWALPGGFLKEEEELKDGVLRELKEETNIKEKFTDIKEIGTFGKIGRDPRRRIISVAFLITYSNLPEISIANESLEVKWLPLEDFKKLELAFDHSNIIKRALEFI